MGKKPGMRLNLNGKIEQERRLGDGRRQTFKTALFSIDLHRHPYYPKRPGT
jgi:hypothetical protein